MSVTVQILREAWADPDLPLPEYQTAGAAGADIVANLPPEIRSQGVTLAPMQCLVCPTGLRVAIPDGYEMQIRPRSGLATKHGVTVLNSPGTIDSDYRGEVGVILINHGTEPFTIMRGSRIAQMVIASVTQGTLIEADTLDATARGAGGFGSTGVG